MTSKQKGKSDNAARSSRRNFIKGTAMATSGLALQSWGFPQLTGSNNELINKADANVSSVHYNGGWADGYHYNIRYWEFWNEPNLTIDWVPHKEQNRPDWSGSPEQFFSLYRKVALALLAYDPNLKVGTGSIAEGGRRSAYREQFIEYCALERVPLDFFSWHHYHENSSDPYDMVRIAKDIRLLLNAYGLRHTESHAGEWNLSIRDEPPQSQASTAAAAFTATALMYMQDAPVDLSHYYSGRAGDMGPFEPDGRFRKKAYVFKAMREMLTAPQRVSATGGDTLGFAVLAGRSRDCSRVNILISNYQMGPVLSPAQSVPPGIPGVETGMPRANQILYENNKGYDLRVSNLPWGKQPFSVRRYRIGEKENFNETLVPSNGSGTFSLQLEMNAPGVDLIILEAKQSG